MPTQTSIHHPLRVILLSSHAAFPSGSHAVSCAGSSGAPGRCPCCGWERPRPLLPVQGGCGGVGRRWPGVPRMQRGERELRTLVVCGAQCAGCGGRGGCPGNRGGGGGVCGCRCRPGGDGTDALWGLSAMVAGTGAGRGDPSRWSGTDLHGRGAFAGRLPAVTGGGRIRNRIGSGRDRTGGGRRGRWFRGLRGIGTQGGPDGVRPSVSR